MVRTGVRAERACTLSSRAGWPEEEWEYQGCLPHWCISSDGLSTMGAFAEPADFSEYAFEELDSVGFSTVDG
jgi:hypothetical protein